MPNEKPGEFDLFVAAIEQPPEARSEFLSRICDDVELRLRIEGLVKASDAAGRFLESPAPGIHHLIAAIVGKHRNDPE